MRKVLSVLAIMAIATGMVFAADAGFIAGREVSEIAEGADLKVTLQVDENMQNYFEIGFSGENVTTFEQEVTPLTKLTIATEKGNGEIGNAGNDAFVYWKAKGADITVSLAKSDNMTGDQGDETLSWNVSAFVDSEDKPLSGSSAVELKTTEGADTAAQFGAAPLTIVTDGLTFGNENVYTSTSFTGTITVTVAAAE